MSHASTAFPGHNSSTPPSIQMPAEARALTYARHLLQQVSHLSREAKPFARWASAFLSSINHGDIDNSDDPFESPRGGSPLTPEAWNDLTSALTSLTTHVPAEPDLVEQIGSLLNLDEVEIAILKLCLDYHTNALVEDLWDGITRSRSQRCGYLSANAYVFGLLTGYRREEIAQRLRRRAALRTSGLLTCENHGQLLVLHRLLRSAGEAIEHAKLDPRDVLFGAPSETTLNLHDFAHLGDDLGRVHALLRGALAQRAHGVHVLLYGAPGTGKTELAKTLAASLGVSLRSVGEADEEGNEPHRHERLAELCLAQKMLNGAGPALLLFDEAEDLFAPQANSPFETKASYPRAFIHRMLEEAQAPVIWTANDIKSFGSAFLRRMSCCLEVKVPPPAARTTLWEKAANDEGMAIPRDDLQRLAGFLPAAPALARSAMRVARMAGGDSETVRWALTGVMRAMNDGHLPSIDARCSGYDPSLVAADIDLAALAVRLSEADAPRNVSLLLSGPPGSGKSAYARYLAECMGLPVMQRRASDLFDKYVGETEKHIAAAFAEAEATRSFLIFDEADSLLSDRRGATRSWEVSQTNEMLTWMERHPLPFCCTTNLIDRLDEAAMRRFLVKAQFGFLKPEQVTRAFHRAFGLEPPTRLAHLRFLTPADFDLVKRAAALHGTLQDPHALIVALEREQQAKGVQSKPIGFQIAA